jgi:5'(3')-deoxyribonucleotidase
MNEKYTVFLDMDGVLVDFNNGYKKIADGQSFEEVEEERGKPFAVEKFLNQGKEFWSNLDWIHGGKELYEDCRLLFRNPRILSSTGSKERKDQHAKISEGKREWLIRELSQINKEDIIIVEDRHLKQKYASKTGILIDDHPTNIAEWNNSGGTGILHNSRNYRKTIDALQDIINPSLFEVARRIMKRKTFKEELPQSEDDIMLSTNVSTATWR